MELVEVCFDGEGALLVEDDAEGRPLKAATGRLMRVLSTRDLVRFLGRNERTASLPKGVSRFTRLLCEDDVSGDGLFNGTVALRIGERQTDAGRGGVGFDLGIAFSRFKDNVLPSLLGCTALMATGSALRPLVLGLLKSLGRIGYIDLGFSGDPRLNLKACLTY